MIEQPTLVVVGTGQLARAVCYSLAASHSHALRVVVIGRRAAAVADLCYVASTRAAVRGGAFVRFQPTVVDAARPREQVFDAELADVLGAASPVGVLVCASTQSPWERLSAPSAWTALVERARFGITLLFQAEHALRVGAALAGAAPGAWLVNACFPDAVNPLLAACGVPVLCGVGNVGLLAASLQSALELPDQTRLRVLGHHVHLYPPASAEDEALAWCDDAPLAGVGTLLAAQRAAARTELNHVTGLTAAVVLGALLTGAELDANLPGPLGLPGGYPVRLASKYHHCAEVGPLTTAVAADAVDGDRGAVELRLPPGVTLADAVARNQGWALADGAAVDGGRVVFSDIASAELAAAAPELADGFDVADLAAVTRRMHELRDRLRDQPCPR